MAKDLKSGDFPTLHWEAEKLAEPLDQLCAYAKNQAQQSIDWYFRKRQLRRHFCRIFRLSAILLTAFAGLLPMINDIVGSQKALHPLCAAVALGVAATLILLDRFYGFTNGWIRYLLTARQLIEALEAFHFEVERHKLSWGNPEPTPEQATMLLEQIWQFHKKALGIVNDETKGWAAEFTEAIKQLDEQVKTDRSKLTTDMGGRIVPKNQPPIPGN